MITREQFDTVYNGLAAQGWKQSFDDEFLLCRYRGPNNTKCAIGHMIPDDKYSPRMDGIDDYGQKTLRSWLFGDFEINKLLAGIHHDEFDQLQKAHDNNDTPAEMKAAFDDLRKEWFPDDPN